MFRIFTTFALVSTLAATPAAIAQPTQPAAPRADAEARAQVPVEYTVYLREPQTQMVEMSMTIRGLTADQGAIAFYLPVWRPGKYAIVDPAGTVRNVAARSGRGTPLACEKIDKSTWVVRTAATEGDGEVTVSYLVYANSLGDRTRHVDDTHAFLSPSTVFMYTQEFRDRPLRVRIQAPEGWRTATGLEPDPSVPNAFAAPNYDVLVDSPLEIGFHDVITFEVDGVTHEVVTWTGQRDATAGLGKLYDKDRIVKDFTRLVEVQRDIFGHFPFQRYVFLIHCYPGGSGGTEHLNSTIMQTRPATFSDAATWRRFMGLVSHEYFHAWNVKQLRPAGLKSVHGNYDYQQENYTDLLWVAEGTTSYYDDLCLVRAGITKPNDYLKTLSNAIDALRNRPGAKVQSLVESSFDAWIKFNKPTPDAVNSTVSFYDKGAMVNLLLDMEIRRRTNNRASLDTVMRELFRDFPLSGPGFTTEDFIRACERHAGVSLRRFFADYVDGVAPLDFESALVVAGLEVVLDGEDAKDDDKDGEDAGGTLKRKAYIGINLEVRDGLPTVASVLADGPAYKAGVVAGDVVLAINGERVKGADLKPVLERIKPGDAVRLYLFRYDQLREIEFTADARPDGKWTVRRVKNPTAQQKATYEAWLGVEWPEPKKASAQVGEPEDQGDSK